MLWQLLADLVLLIHLGFIVFVLLGAILTIWWRWIPWVHLPAALWATSLEFGGWICPLTPLENRLRQAGGEAGYGGGFIEHYVIPLIYPAGLTPRVQFVLGVVVIFVNLGTYGFVWFRKTKRG